jgi:hypothetical protein
VKKVYWFDVKIKCLRMLKHLRAHLEKRGREKSRGLLRSPLKYVILRHVIIFERSGPKIMKIFEKRCME